MSTDIKKARLAKLDTVDLYPVITEQFCKGRTSLEVLQSVLAAGVRMVQLREKHISKGELFSLAQKYRDMTSKAGALLIVNDHVDVALAAGADGVHLGQSDLPVYAARAVAQDLILGASTHNLEQVQIAKGQGVDYVNVGPIYPTGTKPEHKVFLGPDKIAEIAPKVGMPFTVMGGIKEHNLQPVLEAGARIIAVVTAVTAAENVEKAARNLREIITRYSG